MFNKFSQMRKHNGKEEVERNGLLLVTQTQVIFISAPIVEEGKCKSLC